jgi:hypothetical protein
MKKVRLIFAAIGLATALTACGGGAIPAEKLAEKLGKLKANTAATPHTVKLDNTVNISVKGSDVNETIEAEGKYVILDLSECSARDNTVGKDNPFRASNEFIMGIILPKSLTAIGEDAFGGCEYLTGITIPASVTSIGGSAPVGAFYGCGKLASITVAAGNSAFSSAGGVLFDKDKATLLLFPAGKEGDYTIPSSVTSIGADAFYGCSGLSSVTISDSVTSIGEGAFFGCSSLSSVTIPDGVTSIGEYAFEGCSGLSSVTIPVRVTSIGDRSFYGCSGLSSVTIPAGVTSIGERAFYECSSLSSVTFASGSAITRDNFGRYAFNVEGGHVWGGYDPAEYGLRDAYRSGGAGTYTYVERGRTWTKQ